MSANPPLPPPTYDSARAGVTIVRCPGARLAVSRPAPRPSPGGTGESISWRLRLTVYAVCAGALVAAFAAFGDAIPDQVARAGRFLQAAAAGPEAPLSPQEYLTVKSRIWQSYREEASRCAHADRDRQDACFEQARRERKAQLAMARERLAPRPHSAEDRRVAMY